MIPFPNESEVKKHERNKDTLQVVDTQSRRQFNIYFKPNSFIVRERQRK